MCSVRRISVFVLVLTLFLTGIPSEARAGADEVLSERVVTINGVPLSQFLKETTTQGPLPMAALARPEQSPSKIAYGEVQVGQPNLSRRAEVWLAVGIAVGVVLAATIALGCYDADECAG